MKNKKSDSGFDEALKLAPYCPSCGNRYKSDEGSIIDNRSDTQLVYYKCKKCKSGSFILLFNALVGTGTLGMMTDLTLSDVDRFMTNKMISLDDVLDIHEVLSNEGGVEKIVGL